ncbi:MAG: carbon storage regulator CsrA [Eubacteriales bacterium]
MLVLQRKVGESVLIGDETTVTVLAVEGGRVRLAVDAPKYIQILRSELKVAAEENRAASQENASPLALLQMLQQEGEKK